MIRPRRAAPEGRRTRFPPSRWPLGAPWAGRPGRARRTCGPQRGKRDRDGVSVRSGVRRQTERRPRPGEESVRVFAQIPEESAAHAPAAPRVLSAEPSSPFSETVRAFARSRARGGHPPPSGRRPRGSGDGTAAAAARELGGRVARGSRESHASGARVGAARAFKPLTGPPRRGLTQP
eukprot:scaffold3428_cov379-Prasinococcus_capsulatus_cf.AAC.29